LPVERATVSFQGRAVKTPVYERSDLVVGHALKGPAVITEYSATTVIPPGKRFRVDRAGNVLITIK
jgi:N-methylhydantoinase A